MQLLRVDMERVDAVLPTPIYVARGSPRRVIVSRWERTHGGGLKAEVERRRVQLQPYGLRVAPSADHREVLKLLRQAISKVYRWGGVQGLACKNGPVPDGLTQ